MKLKSKLILLGIFVGVISCFGMSSSQASEITSVFSGKTITRNTVQNVELASENNTNLVPVTLGISKDRDDGNWYVWNPLTTAFDEDGKLKIDDKNNVEAQKVWKIAKYSSESATTRDYGNLYYCLNAERGFGLSINGMAEGAKDTYSDSFNMKNAGQKSTITNLAGGTLNDNYNKILWILDNSYIPTNSSNYQKSLEYKKLMNVAGIEVDDDERLNLTEDDIEVVQQLAIWHFTNSESTNYKNNKFPSLYLNGTQLSSIYLYTTEYGEQITGRYRQNKAEKLYNYFIENSDDNYTIKTPTLTLSNTNVTVTEEGDNYIVGPFSLSGTNTDLIKEIEAELNVNATLLNSSKNAVKDNAFSKVIGNNFYLKIAKNSITSKNREITIKLTYTYDERDLTLLTDVNDPTNTQPVVLVEASEKSLSTNTKATIELTSVSVEKIWDDNNNQDGVRPTNISVQLYKDGKSIGNTISLNSSNNWKYVWNDLLTGSYEVKEINNNGSVVLNGGKYNSDYTTTYSSQNNITKITNFHEPTIINISGTKTWEDANNQDGKRPDKIIVNLLADGEIVNSKEVTVGNNWTYTFENLPKYKNGKEIVYTITEDKVENYTTTIKGYNIINSYNPETIEKTVTKNWNDANNQDGKRTEYGVTLKANGKTYGKEIVLNADTLTYTWRNLPKYENGEEIIYTVEETKIPDEYKATYSEDTFTITNTYTPGKTSKKVIKVWNDEENKDELRPSNVNVTLYKTVDNVKTEIESQLLNEENNWMYVWSELDKKESGKDIIYSVEETTVENYTTTYSSDDYQQTDEITITNTHIPIITGTYNVVLKKVDEKGNILKGAKFNINGTEYDLADGEKIILENEQLTSTDSITKIYNITETEVPEGYEKLADSEIILNANVEEKEKNYKITNVVGKINGEDISENIAITLEENTIVITIKNTPIEKKFDLALRKFITQVNDIKYSREPIVDTSTIAQTGTATYKHTKQPIAVQKGDVVTYTIRVYNEGEIDGYAEKITDYIPNHMTPIIIGVDGIDEHKYAKEIEFNLSWGWIISDNGKYVTTMKTSKVNSDTYSLIEGYGDIADTKLDAYVEGSNKLDYIDVQIKCLVTDSAVDGEYLTNIAEITDAQNINGVHSDGVDSKLDNVDYSNLSDYKNEESLKSTTDSYILGQEDDDDFEKLVVKEFDLSLRKFITKVNETTYSREPVVDTSKLRTIANGKVITTAIYTHSKEPVIVETNDIVTYKIRIYNEGSIPGYANEITDNIPEGLEFLPNSDVNVSYKWKMIDKDGNETADVTKAVIITTDYLSEKDKNNLIKEVTDDNGVKTLSYKDVEVQFKVVAKPEKLKDNIIKNEAQISADSDRDIDSTPNRNEKYDYTTGKNEDDIDYEPIKLQYFDLALRKFITKVNSTDYNNRYPEVEFNDDGSITYNHTKAPVLVSTGDTVTYTIRVYNEGEKAGYATQIKDNLPEGLKFDSNNETNKLYGWKMIDKDGNVTEDEEKVVAFTTNYLEKDIIVPLAESANSAVKAISYKDVQIAFTVTESNTSDKILVNTAEISADSDDDIDSTPNNNVESEDDIDKEYVKVEYFDLSLKKWVTETIVTLDGKTTTTKTGFNEDSTSMAKVDIVASKLKKTTVKFKYSIKVTNEGELPGYAYEVKDYIPSGFEMLAEDNENWKETKNNVVVTEQLKDTLLNPGESATVEIVLTWKNSSTNLGVKTNYAEISKDSADDIDSTPDNFDLKEDDIDDAQVILSIKTAGKTSYVGLILISIAILAGGVYGIKKYVLK